jgi:ABC-type Fe3+-hydroxamate transport system substrate-binding protein
MRYMLAVLVCVAGAACSSATSQGTSSSSQSDQATACTYPPLAVTYSDASGSGCKPEAPGKICQVSNGATVLADGGVVNGTETCTSLCGDSQYELSCMEAPSANPDPSLGCTVIPIPTPADVTLYCCPCAN